MEEHQRPHPALSTIGFGGAQAVFSLLSSQAVTHFTALGLHPAEITTVLLSGPVCGLIFQPFFGSRSDRHQSRWGRRRPFILCGSLALISSMILLAWADDITAALMPRSERQRTVLVALTALLTFSIFTALQAVQVGLRAIVTDNSNNITEQTERNAWAGRHITAAAVLGTAAVFIDYGGGFVGASLLVSTYLAVTILLTCWTNSEQPMDTHDRAPVHKVICEVSPQIRMILIVQFFSWMGWFPFLYYAVIYVNSLAAPDNRIGHVTPLVYSTVSFLVSMLLPHNYTNSRISKRTLWASSHAIFSLVMLGTFAVRSALGTVILFSAVGISWAISCQMPYSLIGDELVRLHREEKQLADSQGVIHGIHNAAICLPQIVVMLAMGVMWMAFESVAVDWVLRLSGVSALLAMGFAIRLECERHVEDVSMGLLAGVDMEELDL
ncbi:Sucrose transport protein SUC9 [Talaromyces islandicus]|uniref:Sucrose transport protein SUC9 n=1 Tax=Talaromyces islandicus TaxID=28573 RepID=A0A0U1LWV0_TALIS|nr:Sucrose transport protein SUC9 [Talaromyces islandicus]